MAVDAVSHPAFEHTVMALIAANCVMLGLFDPSAPPDSPKQVQMETVELSFNVVFTVEMFLRIVSLGGVHNYLSNPWNMFDAFMVLAGYDAMASSVLTLQCLSQYSCYLTVQTK